MRLKYKTLIKINKQRSIRKQKNMNPISIKRNYIPISTRMNKSKCRRIIKKKSKNLRENTILVLVRIANREKDSKKIQWDPEEI